MNKKHAIAMILIVMNVLAQAEGYKKPKPIPNKWYQLVQQRNQIENDLRSLDSGMGDYQEHFKDLSEELADIDAQISREKENSSPKANS